MKTLIVMIVDESGSMGIKKTDVIGGFNNFITDQIKIKNDSARLYLVKFNSYVSTIYSGIPLEQVQALSTLNYIPEGGTALYDAIEEGVRLAEHDKTKDERVICVIISDGEDNSSQETTKDQIKKIILEHEAKGDWTFLYIGENPERWTTENGMSSSHGINYDRNSPMRCFERATQAVGCFRKCQETQTKSGLFNTSTL